MRLENPAPDRRLAEAVAAFSEDERSRVAHSLLKVHSYFVTRQDKYVEAIDAVVWALGSTAGKSLPQAKQLRKLIKEITR